MRKIKFRVWSKFNGGTMIFVNENGFYEKSFLHENGYWQSASLHSLLERKDVNIMQYVGLTDKNGRDIYEGDIVKCFVKGHMKVTFKNCGFCLESLKYASVVTEFRDVFGEIEVIGNIYENRGLLID